MDAIEWVRQSPRIGSTADAKQGSEINCGDMRIDRGHEFNADAAKEILDSLLQNKELETLVMEGSHSFGSLESCRAIRELVRTSTTLKHLSLRGVRMNREGLKLIVEGILSNSQSALEALDLGWNKELVLLLADVNEVTDKVGEGTQQSTIRVIFLESWRVLGKLVRTSTTLKHLSLENLGICMEGLKLIVEGILSNSQSALEALNLGLNQDFVLANRVNFLESWRALGKLVRTSTTLKHLSLNYMGMKGEHLKHIVEGIQNNSQAGLETLELSGNNELIGEGAKQLTDLLLGNTRALATLNISLIRFSAGEMESIGKALASNTTLRNLTIGNSGMPIGTSAWKMFFDSFKSNIYLQVLDMLIPQHDAIFEDLMGIFHVNYAIQDIPYFMDVLEGEKRNQLEGMLLRNERLGEYIITLQEQLQFMRPSIGRLFLCGSPCAGKTTLCTSMVGTQVGWTGKVKRKVQSIFQQVHCLKQPNERTQGIEVRSLKAPTGEQLALWDLAGEEEYRALHDNHYLFPEMSQACVFLFVFRPFEQEGKYKITDAASQQLRKELHYWLSFINSNSRKAEVTPILMIVLTHLDKLSSKTTASTYVEWANYNIQDIKASFNGQVEIHDTIQAVNSLSQKDALLVVNEVMTVIGALFPKLPEVPTACEKVNLMLTTWAHAHKAEPIITAEKFFELCQNNVSELKDLFQIDPLAIRGELRASIEEVRLAIVSYLHDSGCIINFQESKWMVIDINWLGQTFLGQLFNPKSQTMQEMIPSTSDGIVRKHKLLDFLLRFIEDGKYTGITPKILVEVMKALKICEDASLLGDTTKPQYFMPCTLDRAHTGESRLQWTETIHDHECSPIYSGLRLQCKDQDRTFLSPGLFLRYQVHLLKKLSTQVGLQYKIKRNLIHVKHSGVEMFIESSGKFENPQYEGDDDYVDILMKYYDQPMSGKQQKYPYGVLELRTFCTSREGCPGVSLEEAILRPECVKRLTPCVYRRKQAILREELKKEMAKHLFVEIKACTSLITESVFDSKIYRHRFEAVHDLKEEEVKATTLLDDWSDIQNTIDREQQSAINQITIRADEVTIRANDVQTEIKIAIDEVQRESKIPISANSQPTTSLSSFVTEITSDHLLDEYQMLSRSSTDCQNENYPVTFQDIQNLERNLERKISRRIERNKNEILSGTKTIIDSTLEGVVKDMQIIQRWQGQQMGMMKNLEQKLQQIAVLPWEQTGSMPRFPYFTRFDVSLKRRILALKIVGEAFKLHFLCEEPNQPHFVKGQEGYDITRLNQADWAKTVRPLISASVDIFLVLVKVVAHVGVGIGNAIPNFNDWQGALPLKAVSLGMEIVLNEIKEANSNTVDHESKKRIAWKCLLDMIVKPMLQKNEFSKEFGLYQVQYKSNPHVSQLSTACYWVCSKCREKADRAQELANDSLELNPLDVVEKSDKRYSWG